MKIRCSYTKMLPIGEIKPHVKNRNKHPEEQITRLAQVMEYQGIRHPIIISHLSGMIVAGHGRLEAAKKLGLTEYPVDFQEFDSEESEYAFLVSDNAIAMWAELDLSGINMDLPDLGPDFNIDNLGIQHFSLDIHDRINKGDENSEWVDTPDFTLPDKDIKLTIIFNSEDERESFVKTHKIEITSKMSGQWTSRP